MRREEVMRQNEFFERLLADAIPTSFENRKHFISSRSHLSMDQDAIGIFLNFLCHPFSFLKIYLFIEYESAAYGTTELLNGFDAGGQQRLYAASNTASSIAAICGAPLCAGGAAAASNSTSSIASAASAMNLTASVMAKTKPKSSKQQHQTLSQTLKQNGTASTLTKRNGLMRQEANGGILYAPKKGMLGEKRISSNGLTPIQGGATTICRDEGICMFVV